MIADYDLLIKIFVLFITIRVLVMIMNFVFNKMAISEAEKSKDSQLTRNSQDFNKEPNTEFGKLFDIIKVKSIFTINGLISALLILATLCYITIDSNIIMITRALIIFYALNIVIFRLFSINKIYIYENGIIIKSLLTTKGKCRYDQLSVKVWYDENQKRSIFSGFGKMQIYTFNIIDCKKFNILAADLRGNMNKVYGIINMTDKTADTTDKN